MKGSTPTRKGHTHRNLTMIRPLLSAADLREGRAVEFKVTSFISELDNELMSEIRLTNSKAQFLAVYFTSTEMREIIRQLIDGVEALETVQHH
jgi:hypothetical protein